MACASMTLWAGAGDLGSHAGVHAHQEEFVVGERPGLFKRRSGTKIFAHVVNARRVDKIGSFFGGR